MTLPPVLEDARDLLLCVYLVLTQEPLPDAQEEPAGSWLLRLGWEHVEAPDGKWLADLVWGDIVLHNAPFTSVSRQPDVDALARVINSFEGP